MDMDKYFGRLLYFISLIQTVSVLLRIEGVILDVQLANSSIPNQGTVWYTEDCQNWKTICGSTLGIDDTIVICRHLGFSGANRAITNSPFGASFDNNSSKTAIECGQGSISTCSVLPGCSSEPGGAVCYGSNYLGCYNSTDVSTLKGLLNVSIDELTVDKCLEFCRSHPNMVFGGLEFGRECYCSASSSSANFHQYERVSDRNCHFQCAGSLYESCGGIGFIAVFNLSVDPDLPVNPMYSPCNPTTQTLSTVSPAMSNGDVNTVQPTSQETPSFSGGTSDEGSSTSSEPVTSIGQTASSDGTASTKVSTTSSETDITETPTETGFSSIPITTSTFTEDTTVEGASTFPGMSTSTDGTVSLKVPTTSSETDFTEMRTGPGLSSTSSTTSTSTEDTTDEGSSTSSDPGTTTEETISSEGTFSVEVSTISRDTDLSETQTGSGLSSIPLTSSHSTEDTNGKGSSTSTEPDSSKEQTVSSEGTVSPNVSTTSSETEITEKGTIPGLSTISSTTSTSTEATTTGGESSTSTELDALTKEIASSQGTVSLRVSTTSSETDFNETETGSGLYTIPLTTSNPTKVSNRSIGGGVAAAAAVLCMIIMVLVRSSKKTRKKDLDSGLGLKETAGEKDGRPVFKNSIIDFPEASRSNSLRKNITDYQQEKIEGSKEVDDIDGLYAMSTKQFPRPDSVKVVNDEGILYAVPGKGQKSKDSPNASDKSPPLKCTQDREALYAVVGENRKSKNISPATPPDDNEPLYAKPFKPRFGWRDDGDTTEKMENELYSRISDPDHCIKSISDDTTKRNITISKDRDDTDGLYAKPAKQFHRPDREEAVNDEDIRYAVPEKGQKSKPSHNASDRSPPLKCTQEGEVLYAVPEKNMRIKNISAAAPLDDIEPLYAEPNKLRFGQSDNSDAS